MFAYIGGHDALANGASLLAFLSIACRHPYRHCIDLFSARICSTLEADYVRFASAADTSNDV